LGWIAVVGSTYPGDLDLEGHDAISALISCSSQSIREREQSSTFRRPDAPTLTVAGTYRQVGALRHLPIAGDKMKLSLALYDALISISVPNSKAKTVVDAWEDDVKNFASKSDLERTESHLESSITALRTDLTALIKEQGADLRTLVERQASQFQSSVSKLESNITVLRWQFWLLVLCFGFPILKNLYEVYGKVITS
jgi:hypothetical protein